jgi:ribosomal protein L37AE/L43A
MIFHPDYSGQYREQTNRMAMSGVCTPRFLCPACGKRKPLTGRAKNAAGAWICEACRAARRAGVEK